MRRFVGPVLMGVGALHVLVVCVGFAGALAGIGRDGMFNAVEPHLDREVAFWSVLFGVLLCTLGSMVRWAYAETGRVPAPPGWTLLGIGVAGGILLPASPFWVAIPLALVLLVSPRGDRGRPDSRASGPMAGRGHRSAAT